MVVHAAQACVVAAPAQAQAQAQAWSSTWVSADENAAVEVVILEGIIIQAEARPAHLRDVPRDSPRHSKAIVEGESATAEAGAAAGAEEEAKTGTAAAAGVLVVRAAAVPLASEEALRQAQAEGLTLRVGKNSTGYFGVCHEPIKSLPYRAQLKCGGKKVCLGNFATAEEAALCVARSPEGQRAAQAAEVAAAAAAPPLTIEEAVWQAQEEGLPLLKAFANRGSTTGYFGVHIDSRSQARPFSAQVWRDGKSETLGHFATAEEAALCVARTPEGQGAAKRAAPALLLQLVPAAEDAAPAAVLATDEAAATEEAAAAAAAAAAKKKKKKKKKEKAVAEQTSGRPGNKHSKTLTRALVPVIAPSSVSRSPVGQLEQHADEQDAEEESGDAGERGEGGEAMQEAQKPQTAQADDNWCVGSRLEALDKVNIWCRASVLATQGEGPSRMLKVHYVGWSKRLDEWLAVSGGRLRKEEKAEAFEEPSTKRRKGKQTAAASEGAEEVAGGRLYWEEGEEQGLISTTLWEDAAASEEVAEEEGLGGRLCQQSLHDYCPRSGQGSSSDEDERRSHIRDCTEHLRNCAEHLRGCMEAVDAAHAEDAASEAGDSESEVTGDDPRDEGQPAGSCLAAWRELGWEAHTSVEPGRGQYWFNWVTGERWWQRPVPAVAVLVQPATGERRWQ